MIDTGLITDMRQTMATWSPTAGYLPGSAGVLPQLSGTFLPLLIGYTSFSAAPLSPAAGTVQVTTFRKVVIVIVNSVRDYVTPRDVT